MAKHRKLRLVTWSVVGLAVLQLVIGRYYFYPFIHWTMFAFLEHEQPKQTVTRVQVILIDNRGDERPLQLRKLFSAVPGSNGAAKTVSKRYINRLRRGDQKAANELARLAQEQFGIQGIVMLRVETWTWDIDISKLQFGKPKSFLDSTKPDHVTEITSQIVAPN